MSSIYHWSGDWNGGGLHDPHFAPQPIRPLPPNIKPYAALGEPIRRVHPVPRGPKLFDLKKTSHQPNLKLSPEGAKEVNAFLDKIIDFEGIEYLIPSNGPEEEDPKSIILVKKRRRDDDEREDRLLIVKPSTQFSSLGHTMRVPEDFFLDPGDSLYLQYFMEEFGEVFSLGIMSGTRPLWNMLSRALDHLPLRYTLIAVSAWLYDGIAGRSRERSVANLRKAIPMIQSAVTSTALDDGHGFAVFLLAYLSVVRGDIKGISLHVGGFYRILRHCNVLREDGSPNSNHTSLAMILWRIGVRTDNIIGVVGQRATFPATTVPDSFHSNWLRDFDNPQRPDTAEWAMAQFALDDLANRATHLAVRSITIQRKIEHGDHDGFEELNVELDMAFLIRDLEAWKRRRILREAESRERARRVAHPSQPPLKFLDYEPLTFADEAYAIMLVQYFTCRIQLSLVTNPQIGPYPAERHMFAIELCRVYAAIGGLKKPGLSGLLVGLVYAALALTDKTCPLEYVWIQGRFRDIDRVAGYSAGSQAIRILDEIMKFRSPAPFWDYFCRATA